MCYLPWLLLAVVWLILPHCQVWHQPGQHRPVWAEHRHGAHRGPGLSL